MSQSTGRVVKIVVFSILAVLVLAFLALMIASGVFVRPKYLEPWEQTYHENFSDSRVKVAAHGMLAPNAFNLQLWKIRLDGQNKDVFYVYADAENSITADENRKELMICQGTFLEFMQIGGKQLGYDTEIQLFPDGEINEADFDGETKVKAIAKVTLKTAEPETSPLYKHLFNPHTNRSAYTKEKLTESELDIFKNLKRSPLTKYSVYTDEKQVEEIRGFTIESKKIETETPYIAKEFAELYRLNEYTKNSKRFGFSAETDGYTGIKMQTVQGLTTIIPVLAKGEGAGKRQVKAITEKAQATSNYLILRGADFSRKAEIEAGRFYARLQLTAMENGITMQPLSQVLQMFDEMTETRREFLSKYGEDGSRTLMLVRIGKPTKTGVKSLRRDVKELIL